MLSFGAFSRETVFPVCARMYPPPPLQKSRAPLEVSWSPKTPFFARLLVTSVMLAVKFFDDVYYSNAYYAKAGIHFLAFC